MKNVTVTGVTITTTVVPVPSDSEDDSGLSDGQVAGLVIGVTLGAILVSGFVYFTLLKIRSEQSSNYGKVTGTNEGEVAVDIVNVYEERHDNNLGSLVLSKGSSEVKI
jgi:hypothetical protein